MNPMDDAWGVEVKPGQAEDVKERVETVNNKIADHIAEDDKKVSNNLDGYSTDPDDYSTDDEYSSTIDLSGEGGSCNGEDSSDGENKNNTESKDGKNRVTEIVLKKSASNKKAKIETLSSQNAGVEVKSGQDGDVKERMETVNNRATNPIAEDNKKVSNYLDGHSTDPDDYSTDDEYSSTVYLSGEGDSYNGEDSSDEENKNNTETKDVKKRVKTINKQVADSIDSKLKSNIWKKLLQRMIKKVTDNLDGYSPDPDNPAREKRVAKIVL